MAKIILGDRESLTLLLGKIDTAVGGEIVGYITENIRQLKGKAEGDGVVGGGPSLAGKNINGDKTDGGSDPVAVFSKVLERLVAILGKIHFDPRDNLEKGLGRD